MTVEDGRIKTETKFEEIHIGECFQYVDDVDLFLKISRNSECNAYCLTMNTMASFRNTDLVTFVKAKVLIYD